MSALGNKTVEVKCPWDEYSWQLTISATYEDAEAIPDPINDSMLGRNENCPKCGHGVFIHYLKRGERRLPRPQKHHRPSPP